MVRVFVIGTVSENGILYRGRLALYMSYGRLPGPLGWAKPQHRARARCVVLHVNQSSAFAACLARTPPGSFLQAGVFAEEPMVLLKAGIFHYCCIGHCGFSGSVSLCSDSSTRMGAKFNGALVSSFQLNCA
jgi:hypothetical protein